MTRTKAATQAQVAAAFDISALTIWRREQALSIAGAAH